MWVYGTYKFDNPGAVTHYLQWVRDTRATSESKPSHLSA